LTDCVCQSVSRTAATVKRADYEIAKVQRGRSTPEGLGLFLDMETVPDAGELQANVSLANADKYVADVSELPTTTVC